MLPGALVAVAVDAVGARTNACVFLDALVDQLLADLSVRWIRAFGGAAWANWAVTRTFDCPSPAGYKC